MNAAGINGAPSHEGLSVDCQVLGLGFDGKGDFKECDMIIFAFSSFVGEGIAGGGGAEATRLEAGRPVKSGLSHQPS